MLISCPHCGHDLEIPLKDGIGSCGHCDRVYDTSPFNRILSAAWYVRRHNCVDVDQLIHMGVKEPDAFVALTLVYDADYSHDELLKILKSLGISKEYVIE